MFLFNFSLFALVICNLDFISGISHTEEVVKREVSSTNNLLSKWSPVHDIPEGWVPTPWISDDVKLGQVSGVAVDQNDHIYIFHRADRVWNMNSFTLDHIYNQRSDGPITSPTVLVFHSNGTLLRKLGSNMFYLPHGITVDQENNIWVTDVALHQVMKFPPLMNSPLIVIGEKFVPGRDSRHLCKPTSIAVTSSGDFFVADGYCNSRILKISVLGVKLLEWGRSTVNRATRRPDKGELLVPHAVTVAEDKELVCVADRENGRVQCFHMTNGSYVMELSSPLIGSRLFSVTYSPVKGGLFFVVNGPEGMPNSVPVRGFVISAAGKFISQFGTNLRNPHDIAVSSDGKNIYVGEIGDVSSHGRNMYQGEVGPFKAWKFVHNESVTHVETESVQSERVHVNSKPTIGGLAGAVLITGACLIFAAAVLIAAFVYSRSKKSGTPDTRKLLSSDEF